MIYAITQFVNFDIEQERKRLHTCFEGDIRERQLNIFHLFLDGKYQECYQSMALLPYDDKKECDEAEYVHTFIFENVRAAIEHPNVRIEPLNEYEQSAEAKVG